jgi:hypothetical protein
MEPRRQFGISSILLATAFVAVWLTGCMAANRIKVDSLGFQNALDTAAVVVIMGPYWLPIAVAAYCMGRRTISAKHVIGLAVIEAVSVAIAYATFFS